MYFKKLELIGFKSFFNKTTLHFEPGITAIVGPNGCGKSNIFDSIRWVLGEQSVKSMRGSAMEDVIFNGSDSKEAVGMAEVSLTFDNSNKFFPVDQEEVVITRRIFRSGESEYLLNKTQVRLKDILELLMGTGIGSESYSLIPQGKIDMILSSKPEDRRLVFDEASGITKYKSQKKEALRRLEETEQNLLRINDIILEVKRQIGTLERQANKAKRYKEVFEELKISEGNLAAIEKNELENKRAQIQAALENLTNEEAQLLAVINVQESNIGLLQAELKSKEDTIIKIKNDILGLENLKSSNSERIDFSKKMITELDSNKNYLELQLELVKNRLVVDEEKLTSLKEEYSALKTNIDEKTGQLRENEIRLNGVSSAIRMSTENISSDKKHIMELAQKIANAKNGITGLASKQQIYIARNKRLAIEKVKVEEEKTASLTCISSLKTEIDALENDFNEAKTKLLGLKSELDNEKTSLSNISEESETLEKQKMSLQSQKQFIEELRTKYDDISESMSAVIYLDKSPSEKISGLVIKINDYIALGANDAGSGLTANAKVLGEAKPFDLDTNNISERITQLTEKIENLKIIKAEKLYQIENLELSSVKMQETLKNQEIFLANRQTSYQAIMEEFNKIKGEEELIDIELNDVDTELTVLDTELVKSEAQLVILEQELKTKEESISQEQDNITSNNSQKEEILVIIAKFNAQLEALHKRISSDGATIKMMEDRYNQDKESLGNLQKQIEDAQSKKQSLEIGIADLYKAIEQVNLELSARDNILKDTEDARQESHANLNSAQIKIGSDKFGLDSLKTKQYEFQMQDKDFEFKYLSLKEKLLQSYSIELENIHYNPCENANPFDKTTLQDNVMKLKERAHAYGAVNLVAIEEYEELKKRYDFLSQQQNDLITAKEALHNAILKISRTTKKMFLETFEKVCVEFRNYFKLLFNGGDAQIYLLDPNDPLESGIEIICRPPGKKLQNVLLLSGGEKSMSAIALIFAIFKIKPAPFCVLDEIDAALDEANVDRFGRALLEFASISQFIVITHNKKTISNADIMYGITMEESGVSKIVSVKFAQHKTVQAISPDSQAVTEPV